jgi:uncharacterized repeat protein (TIGR03803 family)
MARFTLRFHFLAFAFALLVLLTTITTAPAASQTLNVLHTFTGAQDGGNPGSGLTMDAHGNLYGTTSFNGLGYGTVFKLARSGSGWVLTPIYSFHGSDGADPNGVVFGPDGNLYGTTASGGGGNCGVSGYQGCGTIFRLQPPASACKSFSCPWNETVIYEAQEDNGVFLYGNVTFDKAGNRYTTVFNGGPIDAGYVVELTLNGGNWSHKIIYNFDPFEGGRDDGSNPVAGVIFDASGNLYGTTVDSGAGGCGVVYELSPSGSNWTETILHGFFAVPDGCEPYAPLAFDAHGNLWGTTSDVGPQEGGTIFEFTPNNNGGWTFSTQWAFSDEGGGGHDPSGPLVFDTSGDIWGTTGATGCCGFGTIFELTPVSGGGWSENVLYYFEESGAGANPNTGLIFDAQGNAYGTTGRGGNDSDCNDFPGCGTVWQLSGLTDRH